MRPRVSAYFGKAKKIRIFHYLQPILHDIAPFFLHDRTLKIKIKIKKEIFKNLNLPIVSVGLPPTQQISFFSRFVVGCKQIFSRLLSCSRMSGFGKVDESWEFLHLTFT